jgi:hypothetical protein
MVRSAVLFKLRSGTTQEQINAITSAVQALHIPGLVSMTFGPDLGLREGNMSFAFVVDFEDEPAFRAYDADEHHNHIRRDLIAPVAERIERCQFQI